MPRNRTISGKFQADSRCCASHKEYPNRLKEMTLYGENEILPTVAASHSRNDYDWLCRSMLNEILNGFETYTSKEKEAVIN